MGFDSNCDLCILLADKTTLDAQLTYLFLVALIKKSGHTFVKE